MEDRGRAELAAAFSTLNLVQTRHIIPIFKAQSDEVAISLQNVKRFIQDLEEQARSSIENYQRASHKRRQILERSLRKKLANCEQALMDAKKRQKALEVKEMTNRTKDIKCGLAIQLAGGDHGHYIAGGEPILQQSPNLIISPNFNMVPKRTASEMMGSSGKAAGGPFKRIQYQEMGKMHPEFSKSIQELEQTNKEYEDNIEKNRQEIVDLKREEEVILAIQKQGMTREKALQKFIQWGMARFLEDKLEKESEGDRMRRLLAIKGRRSKMRFRARLCDAISDVKTGFVETEFGAWEKSNKRSTNVKSLSLQDREMYIHRKKRSIGKKHEIEEDEAELCEEDCDCWNIKLKDPKMNLKDSRRRKLLRVAQDRGEEFSKTLLKAGKDELEEVIKGALSEAEL
ncbi:hypothetical protein BPOR_0749g00060 [Botrytis porri]|uniref:Uncharacterized protein n=1 Tax=Botrytis porri TaxID=87229 RepID=A0A4Z1K9R4_9HELO|nr:hypothetical protein BPOR_0749g00060 [Botrytis porri]